MGKPRVRSRICAPRPGDERRDVPAAPGCSAADVWKEHTSSVIRVVPVSSPSASLLLILRPSSVACPILGGSLTGCLMCPGVGIEAGSDPDPTVFSAQLWTHPLPARPTERELHAALNGIETTPHPHTTTRRHRAITVDHLQRSSLSLSRMHPPTPFLPLCPRSSTSLDNCYGNFVWRARRMGSLPPREGAAGGEGARSCGPAGTRSVQEKRYFGRREMGMGKGTLWVGSRGRASAGEAHASGRANRPYAVRERAGGWEVLPDSAVALGLGPDWDTEETRTLMWLAMGCCRYRGIPDPRVGALILRWRPFGRAFVVSGSALRVGEVVVREKVKVKVVGFCQPERSLSKHGVLQVLYIFSEGAIGLWDFGRAVKLSTDNSSVPHCLSFAFTPSCEEMPLLAFALTYGSFGDIKETFAMAWRLYKILRDRGGSSDEIQKVLKVLECHRADIATLISLLQTDSPPNGQQYVNNISAELDWCHSHMAKLCAEIAPSKAVFAYFWSAFSVERALASWRAQMADHRAVLSGQLQLLLVALSIDGHQQLQRMASQIQYVGAEVERVRSEVRETGSLIMATTARQISDAESNIMQRLIQGMNLHYVSVAMFSVTDPLGRSIPISLAHCGDFEALDRMLKACIFNRPEAGARYVERDFAQTVKSGTQLDMSIIKRPRFPHTLDPEKCPYCNEENPKTTGNEWIHCSNHQCGRRYQISVKLADKIEAIEEIYSPQLLTKGDETWTQEQQKENTDLFRLVEIQATYDFTLTGCNSPSHRLHSAGSEFSHLQMCTHLSDLLQFFLPQPHMCAHLSDLLHFSLPQLMCACLSDLWHFSLPQQPGMCAHLSDLSQFSLPQRRPGPVSFLIC
ncbi:hypothetical protein B0H14DRAFT_2601834 [Mycena olivaceomarginata]|nr:hypothetical protein B0H14DRAFT_2601834 [Mycena olivaceomarginata]